MAITVSHNHVVHAAFASSLVCQTFDRMILGRLSFLGTRCFQGGTRWKHRAHKWYAIRKSLGTAGISEYNQEFNADIKVFGLRERLLSHRDW